MMLLYQIFKKPVIKFLTWTKMQTHPFHSKFFLLLVERLGHLFLHYFVLNCTIRHFKIYMHPVLNKICLCRWVISFRYFDSRKGTCKICANKDCCHFYWVRFERVVSLANYHIRNIKSLSNNTRVTISLPHWLTKRKFGDQ